MASRRMEIRKKLVEFLKGKTDAGNNVFPNLSTPFWSENLPAIAVYPRSESVEMFSVAPKEWTRTLEMAVEIVAKGPEVPCPLTGGTQFLEDALDLIAAQVECELSRDDTVGCTADDINLISSEFQFEGDGEAPIGSARLVYNVIYHTMVPESQDKQSGLSDFKKVAADWQVGHHDDAPDETDIEAQDEVDIPIV